MGKKILKGLIVSIFLLGIVLFIAPQEAEASTYYGNGVSCTKKSVLLIGDNLGQKESNVGVIIYLANAN
ncbi:hypothetical protein LHA31_12385 (plasmid) [Carnobacterium viridans]|uniref:hypothetical protein n=1 Tax=Carnobacterium viridans TaxID=174587 RepID=UPI001CFF7F54|nr:hypothetical protein [Carnobacterium viridans]UDE96443.1 hypothetical protein LHA31_12385 [Carnobacterium viridans]